MYYDKKIEWFANRILFSICELGALLCYLVSLLIYWSFWCPFCCIPIIKKNIIKKYGIEDYKLVLKSFNDWSPYGNSRLFYRTYFRQYQTAILLFFLPISLFLNVVIIIVGNPLKLLCNNCIGIISLIVIIVQLSSWLSDYFFWKKDRHYAYIKTFMKENLVKRIAWVVGTYAVIFLLIIVNLKLFGYIINAH